MSPGSSWSPILPEGDWLVSPSGLFNAVQQHDGNFIVYYGSNPGAGPALVTLGTYTPNLDSTFKYAAYTTKFGNLANQLFLTPGGTPPPYSQNINPQTFFCRGQTGRK